MTWSEERLAELEELVVRAMGGLTAVRHIADLPALPASRQPDTMRDLARFIVGAPIGRQ